MTLIDILTKDIGSFNCKSTISWVISDNPSEGQKSSGSILSDYQLIGKKPADFMIIDGNVIQWIPLGITFNSITGVFDFTVKGNNYLQNNSYITIQF